MEGCGVRETPGSQWQRCGCTPVWRPWGPQEAADMGDLYIFCDACVFDFAVANCLWGVFVAFGSPFCLWPFIRWGQLDRAMRRLG